MTSMTAKPTASQHSSSMVTSNRLQIAIFVVILATGALLAFRLGLFSPHFREALQAALRELGPWAPLAFAAIKVITVVLALPSAPVTFTGGVLFGPVWGTVINVAAATFGASCTFFIGRGLGREAVEQRLHGQLKALDEGLAKDGLAFMLFLRLVPLFPFNAINYGAGLTRMTFKDYFVGTLVGIIPGAAIFTYLGSAASESSPRKLLAGLALLGVLALVPVVARRWRAPSDPDATVEDVSHGD